MSSSRLGIAKRLDPQNRVQTETMSLQRNGGSVKSALMLEALRHAEIDIENPGTVKQHYLYNEGLLVLDLRGEFEDE